MRRHMSKEREYHIPPCNTLLLLDLQVLQQSSQKALLRRPQLQLLLTVAKAAAAPQSSQQQLLEELLLHPCKHLQQPLLRRMICMEWPQSLQGQLQSRLRLQRRGRDGPPALCLSSNRYVRVSHAFRLADFCRQIKLCCHTALEWECQYSYWSAHCY